MKTTAILSAGLLVAGALVAQTTPATSPHASQGSNAVHSHARQGAVTWQDHVTQRLTARLNLTADQQQRVKAIFKESRDQNQPLAAEIHDERMALRNAVKTDNPAQIDQIMQANQGLNAKVGATYLKAMAKIYTILTPDQKAKFDHEFAAGGWNRES